MGVPTITYDLAKPPLAPLPEPPPPNLVYADTAETELGILISWPVETLQELIVKTLDVAPLNPGPRTSPEDRVDFNVSGDRLRIGGYFLDVAIDGCRDGSLASYCECEHWDLVDLPIQSPPTGSPDRGYISCHSDYVEAYAQWALSSIVYDKEISVWKHCQDTFAGLQNEVQRWWEKLPSDQFDDRGVPLPNARYGAWNDELLAVNTPHMYGLSHNDEDLQYALTVHINQLGDTSDDVDYGYVDIGGGWTHMGGVTITYL